MDSMDCLSMLIPVTRKTVERTTLNLPIDLVNAVNIAANYYNDTTPSLISKMVHCASLNGNNPLAAIKNIVLPLAKITSKIMSKEVANFITDGLMGGMLSNVTVPFPTRRTHVNILESATGDIIPVFSGIASNSYEASYLLACSIEKMELFKDTPYQETAAEIKNTLEGTINAYIHEQTQWVLSIHNYLDITEADELEEFERLVIAPLKEANIL